MRVEGSSAGEMLAELRRLLASDQLPVQEEIAKAAGIHQSLVSRAANGQLKRITRKVADLLDYARSCAAAEENAAAASRSIEVEVTTSPAASAPDGIVSVGRTRRRRGGSATEAYQRQARDGVESYLNEGYDPRLILDQLVVLRRAQRLRRPGPPPPEMQEEKAT